MKLQLKDLDFGKTDARNEYDLDKKFFLSSFYAPSSFDYKDYLAGKKYYIVGGKGTGKTALLMYLHSLKKGNSKFILYKEDIDEEQKSDFLDLMNADLREFTNKEVSVLNFEKVWQLYLHKLVVEELSEKKFFVNNDFFKKYKKIIDKINKESLLSMDTFLLKLKAGFKYASASVDMNVNVREKEKEISNTLKELDELYLKLTVIGPKEYFFFIDEIELNRIDESNYVRDTVIIRDLIIALKRMNFLSNKNNASIKWVMAIRSEVMSSVYSYGKEINKLMEDFGHVLSWTQNGGNHIDNPLIKIISKKIRASEEKFNIDNKSFSDKEIFYNYFVKEIFKEKLATENYILRQTYMKPRDVVRLCNMAVSKYGNKYSFSQEVLEGIRESYGQNTWSELCEELTSKYTSDDLIGIKMILQGSKPINYKELCTEIERKRKQTPIINELLEKHGLSIILQDLYSVGIIGNNSNGKTRFSYRGQEYLDLDYPIIRHESIKKILI